MFNKNTTFTVYETNATDFLTSWEAVECFAAKRARDVKHVGAESECGWVTNDHILDAEITEEKVLFGNILALTLRTAVRKIPTLILESECKKRFKAYQQEFDMKPSRKQKKQIQSEISDVMLPEITPTLDAIEFIFDGNTGRLYLGTASSAKLELFENMFYKTTKVELERLDCTALLLGLVGQSREDYKPVFFTGAESFQDAYEGSIGQDFLTWLLYWNEVNSGLISDVEDGTEWGFGIDGPLKFVYEGRGAGEAAVKKGMPTVSKEAQTALKCGKKLQSCKLLFGCGEMVYKFGVDVDDLAFKSMKLPEDTLAEATTDSEELEAIVESLDIFWKSFQQMFDLFLNRRDQHNISEWVKDREGVVL